MGLRPYCDRCRHEGQIVPVLGMDLCGKCCEDAKRWLREPFSVPLRKRQNAMAVDRIKQAENLLARAVTFDARKLASLTGEPYRRTYNSMMFLVRQGYLEHHGRGWFARGEKLAVRGCA